MAGEYRIDHIVVHVPDLAQAMEDYRRLGFRVHAGGVHPRWGSRNALIGLADGSYLELIAFDQAVAPARPLPKQEARRELRATGRSVVESRVLAWSASAPGLVDYALLPGRIEHDIAQAARRGLNLDGPYPGGRTRPDGREVSWQLAIPETFDVPFLCGDVTDRSLRVPGADAADHPNGVAGIARIAIAVEDLTRSTQRYEALLGEPHGRIDPDWPHTQAVAFAVGSTAIVLAAPVGGYGPLLETLETRGEGPFLVELLTRDRNRLGLLDPTLTHGAALGLVAHDT